VIGDSRLLARADATTNGLSGCDKDSCQLIRLAQQRFGSLTGTISASTKSSSQNPRLVGLFDHEAKLGDEVSVGPMARMFRAKVFVRLRSSSGVMAELGASVEPRRIWPDSTNLGVAYDDCATHAMDKTSISRNRANRDQPRISFVLLTPRRDDVTLV